MRYVPVAVILILTLPAGADDVPTAVAGDVPAGEIAGVVTNADGQPIEGALVDAWTWYPGNETRTDKSGHFHLKKLDVDRMIELRISKEGYCPWYEPQQPTGVGDLRVALGSKTYFEGTVYSRDGKPVPNALVRADCGPKLADRRLHILNVWTETRSDDAGHYKLLVAPDSYLINTRLADVGVAYFRTAIEGDQAIAQDIHLEAGVRLVIDCVDGDTGAPVPGVKLNVGRQKGMQATSDAGGQAIFEHMPPDKFEFDVSSRTHVKWWCADAANQRLRDRPQGLALRWEGIELSLTPDMGPVKIELERGITISGRVVDPEGQPVSGATIATAKYGWGDAIDSTKRFTARTNARGAFSVVLPASGDDQYTLIAHDGDYGKWRKWANGVTEPMQTKAGEDKGDVTIKLTRPATIRGRVLDTAGTPAANKWVRAMSDEETDSRYVAPETHSDADGNFELKFVRPGGVLVQVEPFYMKDDSGQSSPIAGVHVSVGENELKEGVSVTAPR
jgi:protocatechuate 3,4-dioxygenase beta subunit